MYRFTYFSYETHKSRNAQYSIMIYFENGYCKVSKKYALGVVGRKEHSRTLNIVFSVVVVCNDAYTVLFKFFGFEQLF